MEITFKGQNLQWDAAKILTKWEPILNILNFSDTLKPIIANYAEYHMLQGAAQNKTLDIEAGSSSDTLPISLKILSQLNLAGKTLELVGDEIELPTPGVSINIKDSQIIALNEFPGIDIISRFESVLIHQMVQEINTQLEKGTKLQVRCVVNNIMLIREPGFPVKMSLTGFFQVC
jgi:hypothetical protein